MKRALEIRVPQRMPHVSRFRAVFVSARLRNVSRRCGGSIIVLSGAPASLKAVGLKVYFDGVDCWLGGGEGVAVWGLGGTGGACSSRYENLFSRASLAGKDGGGPAGLGAGCRAGILQSMASSLVGTDG